MSIPVGVTTVLVSAVPQTTGPIVPGTVTVSVTPTQNLVWSSTGQSLASMCNISPTPGWVQLPAVDQAGFVTPDTRAATVDWAYLVTAAWTQTDGSLHTESGTVQCFSNQQVEYLSGTGGVLTPAAVYPIGGVALGGWVDTYAHLPSTLTAAQAGATYMVQADDLMYVWSGTAWPLSGHGFSIVGPQGVVGETGGPGPANTLTIGSVTIGTPVSASLTGTSPNQTLNLVLPEARWWTGSGAPGTVTGSVSGDMYLDNSGTGNLYQLQSGTWVYQGSILGPQGQRGSDWYSGSGSPGTISGQTSGDYYLDTSTGNVYKYS